MITSPEATTATRRTRPGLGRHLRRTLLSTAAPICLVAGLVVAGGTTTTTASSTDATDLSLASAAKLTAGKPTASNTGVPRGTKLRVHRGNLVVKKKGARIDRMDVRGFIIVKAPNVRITRTIVRGGRTSGNIGLITNYGSRNLVIKDTTLKPSHRSVWVDGLKGWNFKAYRVHVVGGVDSAKIHGSNVTIKNSLLENTHYFASDPNQGGGETHNDNVQVLKGRNIKIVRNTIRGASNFAVLAAPEQGATTVRVVGNWLDGGHCTVKFADKGGHGIRAVATGNKFGPNRAERSCVMLATPRTTFSASTNVWEANGRTVPILRKAD